MHSTSRAWPDRKWWRCLGRLLRKPVALKIVGDNAWEYAIRKGLTNDGIDEFQAGSLAKLRFVRTLVPAMPGWYAPDRPQRVPGPGGAWLGGASGACGGDPQRADRRDNRSGPAREGARRP